jgi:hypothetical protein
VVALDKGLGAADVVVIVLSPNYVSSVVIGDWGHILYYILT